MLGQVGLLQAAQACRLDDRFKLFFGVVQIVVDQHVIIAVPAADLVPAFAHPFFDDLVTVLPATDKTSVQFGDRRRQQEDRQRVLAQNRVADLLCALPINVEQHVTAVIYRRLYRALGRAVEIAENMRVFQHLAIGHLRLEVWFGHEMVMLAIHFARTCRPRGR